MRKIIINLFIFLVLISSVNAQCTLDFDSASYFRGETVTAEMICDGGSESNRDYIVTWRDQTGATVSTDIGITPSVLGTLFAETYEIPLASSITNINATLTGTNLEGEDTASVSAPSPSTLILTNFTSSRSTRLGELAAIQFNIINGDNKTVNNAICSSTITNVADGAPIAKTKPENSYDGIGHLELILEGNVFEEGRTYLSTISCMCINNTENRCFVESIV